MDKEKAREISKIWYKNNSERRNEIARRKYKENPEKERERSKQYYRKTKETRREIRLKRSRKGHKEYREWIKNYKLSKGCAICGYKKCASALDFHHNGNKEFNITRVESIKKVKVEITKCIVLCRNCHSELHEKEREKND